MRRKVRGASVFTGKNEGKHIRRDEEREEKEEREEREEMEEKEETEERE